MPAHIYFAIGDIHGESAKLAALHDAILDRIAFENAPARIIHLGDYVDRGPDSRGVIEQILKLERLFEGSDRIEVISLMGNHEQMMLDAYDAGDAGGWWSQGGAETVESYADDAEIDSRNWRDLIPREHITWMRHLPLLHYEPDNGLAFVHAGIEPATFPLEDDNIYLWTRSDRFFDDQAWPERAELADLMVVHGHTPKSYDPEILPHRINVDTGACFGGPLTAVVLKAGEPPQFIRAT